MKMTRCNECGAVLNGDSRELVGEYICLCGNCNSMTIDDIEAAMETPIAPSDTATRRDVVSSVASYSQRLARLDREEGL